MPNYSPILILLFRRPCIYFEYMFAAAAHKTPGYLLQLVHMWRYYFPPDKGH